MAKPRIFVSSTFYDLRQIRSNLDSFIKNLGYESVRHEEGRITYGKEKSPAEYSYDEINFCDIIVSIIGGKYGSESSTPGYSITQMEIKSAIDNNKPVYIFIEKGVFNEFKTYLDNKDNKDINFHFVDNIKIYEFIEFIENLPRNNAIFEFETSDDIVLFLKEQWSGLFQRLLLEQGRKEEISLINKLESTSKMLNQMTEFLISESKGKDDAIKDILLSNHPAMNRVKDLLHVSYRVYFTNFEELNDWLKARSYILDEFLTDENNYVWTRSTKSKDFILFISNTIFDENGNLKIIKDIDWNDNYITLDENEIVKNDDDNMPF